MVLERGMRECGRHCRGGVGRSVYRCWRRGSKDGTVDGRLKEGRMATVLLNGETNESGLVLCWRLAIVEDEVSGIPVVRFLVGDGS